MSQGDYLKHKKTAHLLKEDKLKPVLSGNEYASFKSIHLVILQLLIVLQLKSEFQ